MSINQTLITAAHSINNVLQPAEADAKAAAISGAELVVTMLRQHAAAGLSDTVGLTAIGHASRASSFLVEAREAHIRAHGALNRDLKAVGLERMYGKVDELPRNDEASTFWTGAELAQPQAA